MSLADSLIVKTEVIIEAIRNDVASEAKMRETGKPSPVYENKEYLVFTRANGDKWIRPAYPLDRTKPDFKEAFAAFDALALVKDSGTLLKELQGITPAEIATLTEVNFATVEALAKMGLAQAQALGEDGRFEDLRRYAQSFLRQREDLEKVFHLEKEAEEKDLEIIRLKRQLEGQEVVADVEPTVKKVKAKAKITPKKKLEL